MPMPTESSFRRAGGDALIVGIGDGAGSPYCEQQAHAQQPFPNQFQHESSDQRHLTAATESVPPVVHELNGVLQVLTDTKESRTAAATWFIDKASFGPALARAMLDRVLGLEHDFRRQIDVVYVVGEILENSLARRSRRSDLDWEALAFLPVLETMLTAVHRNHPDPASFDSWVRVLLEQVYMVDHVTALNAMLAAQSAPSPSVSSVGLHPRADSRDFYQVLKEVEMRNKAVESTLLHEGNGETSYALQTMLLAGLSAIEMGNCITTFRTMTSEVGNLKSEVGNLKSLYKEKEREMVHMLNELQQTKKQLYDVQNEKAAQEQRWTAERVALVELLEEQSENLETEKRESLCKICFTTPRDTFIHPCRHFDYCFTCLETHKRYQEKKSDTNTCPSCRAPIHNTFICSGSTS